MILDTSFLIDVQRGTRRAVDAATALEYDEPVVTDDVRDFQRIPAADLRVETY